ncbi:MULTISPECIES: glycoside hydrolase family 43 protein [unclassified Paenibacillus]|uniref:glycoside hydrolase family 43 protein n=1 Tax=unclassified Paenibacillus TaxID=185978 RepID=UPI0009A67EA4|nr:MULTISPECIES: glycoside hydrolase family 43 protein [unclassified Paenibacillus]SLK12314.1 Glycosyl hydrolases family 43 [Paenibacillus sp. RU5A]SOC72610.1 Glycosyl hydrolases family 43 [Paenibacillus sp. RU26A]SOC74981.1 Glycosyl hydrolases family 43 [Paenibacillus sp. RU5M]
MFTRKRWSTRLFKTCKSGMIMLLGALLLLITLFPNTARAATSVYTISAFTNTSESNLYIYESYNATNYGLLKGPAYTPPANLIRDPSIKKHTDGLYYVVYTTNWSGNTIGIASSTDKVNWTFVRNITLSPPTTIAHTWAPEWFKDSNGSLNIIVSISPGNYENFKPYVITATNATLSSTTWSAATELAGIAPNYIDTFIVKTGSTYHAFTKNETTKYIEYATATSLTGPYTFKGTGDWAGWGSWVEGPALVQLDNGSWRIYFDGYSTQKYYYSDSADGFQTWSAKQELAGLTGLVRHMTVLKETGQPGDIRKLESYNVPGSFIRHYNYQARIDASVSPAEDAQFRIVPGLANATGISFESMNYPGYFLRNNNGNITLVKNDGSATFRNDATFKRVNGLANAAWTSYALFSNPNQYLRHYNNVLKLEAVVTALDKSDATFREVAQ